MNAVVVRSTCRSQKCKKLKGTEHFWTFRCRFAWQAQGIVYLVKSEPKREGFVAASTTTTTTLHSTTLHSLHYTHYIRTATRTTLHHTTLRYTNYITSHYTTRITLHFTPLHPTALHYINKLRHNYDYNELQLQLHYEHDTSLH